MTDLKNDVCIIISAGDTSPDLMSEKRDGDLLIAADAGYKVLKDAGIEPDVFVGDGDSLGHIPDIGDRIVLPKIKDDTDTVYAARMCLERGCTELLFYGALGGRLDHTFANIQTLTWLKKQGAEGYLIGKKTLAAVIGVPSDPLYQIRSLEALELCHKHIRRLESLYLRLLFSGEV